MLAVQRNAYLLLDGSFEDFSESDRDGMKRLLRNVNRNAEAVGKTDVEAAKQRRSAGKHDSLIDDVSHEFRRRVFDC